MPRPPSTEPRVRLNLELPERVRERIESLRVRGMHDSLTETIRRAIDVYGEILEAQASGGKVILRGQDGKDRWVVIV